jgi:exosome complex component RRP46
VNVAAVMARARRKELELRPIKIEQRILKNHDGSALFAFGPVKALAAISGPSEVRIRDERTDRAALQIHFTPLQGVAGTSAVAFEQAMTEVWTYALQLHLYPRGLVQIHLQTYAAPSMLAARHTSSSSARPPVQTSHPDAAISVALKAAHINASTLACLDAATDMRCLVAATSAVVTKKGVRANQMKGWRAGEEDDDDDDTMIDDTNDFEVLLDPSPYEESVARSTHVFAFAFELLATADDRQKDNFAPRLDAKLIYNESAGDQREDDYFDCLSLCREACKQIVVQMRQHVSATLIG